MKKAMESLMAANEEKVVLGHKFPFPLLLEINKRSWHLMLIMMLCVGPQD